MSSQETLELIRQSVISGDMSGAKQAAEEALATGVSPIDLLNGGLIPAMRAVGEKWNAMEIFLPEVLLAVEAWNSAMEIIEPRLSAEEKKGASRGTVVIGSVKGDIHDIGKNIVATLLKTAGFEVRDLGIDVPASAFIADAEKAGADIIAASALMTTTMPFQRDIVEYLKGHGKREQFFVLVGGAPCSSEWAREIGADAYGETAESAVQAALKLMNSRQ